MTLSVETRQDSKKKGNNFKEEILNFKWENIVKDKLKYYTTVIG